jgi:glutathione synthase/RimK-type ligase-like ATP-grasp enzyme
MTTESGRKQVVIVGSSRDPNACYVAAAVERLGGQAFFFETAKVPEQQPLSWVDGVVMCGGVPLHAFSSFYLKAIHLSIPTADPGHFSARNADTWHEQYVAERERHSFLTSVLRSLETPERTFVNSIASIDLHFLKLHQLAILAQHGVPVPSSLGTCDPEAIQAFVAQYESVIYKPFAGGTLVRRLSEADLDPQRLAHLRNAPVLFQEEIKGEEFRVYVLDGQPVKAFQLPTEGVVDAREALDGVVPVALDDDVWSICIEAAKAVGLVFSAVDVRRTPEGRIVVLECNPTPAISFFDDPKEGTVITALASFLLSRA